MTEILRASLVREMAGVVFLMMKSLGSGWLKSISSRDLMVDEDGLMLCVERFIDYGLVLFVQAPNLSKHCVRIIPSVRFERDITSNSGAVNAGVCFSVEISRNCWFESISLIHPLCGECRPVDGKRFYEDFDSVKKRS